MKSDRNAIFEKISCTDDERMALSHVLDKLSQSESRNIPTHTGFLSPREQELARRATELAGRKNGVVFHGGCYGAERKIISFLPDYIDEDTFEDSDENPIRAVHCAFSEDEKPTHRDFLGSLMGLGIARGAVGDIMLDAGSCDIFLLENITPFVLENFVSAGRTKFKPCLIERWEANVPAAKVEDIRDTVSSLRLDGVVSSGFRISRSKASALIIAGRVEVNWQECRKTDRAVAEGDCITARGLGKFELSQVGGLSKKGRTVISIRRYI